MAQFTPENAADNGRRGGQQSHQQREQQNADLGLAHLVTAGRVAQRIQQGNRLVLALHVVKLVDQMHKGGC